MRSLRDVERKVARTPVHVGSKADEAILEHLLRELPASEGSSTGRPAQVERQIMRPMAYAATVAMAAAVVAWLVWAGRAPENQRLASVAPASTSRIALLTEISLERAFRHGGIPAVESQFQKALAAPAGKRALPSFDELLAELAGTGQDTGGTRS